MRRNMQFEKWIDALWCTLWLWFSSSASGKHVSSAHTHTQMKNRGRESSVHKSESLIFIAGHVENTFSLWSSQFNISRGSATNFTASQFSDHNFSLQIFSCVPCSFLFRLFSGTISRRFLKNHSFLFSYFVLNFPLDFFLLNYILLNNILLNNFLLDTFPLNSSFLLSATLRTSWEVHHP